MTRDDPAMSRFVSRAGLRGRLVATMVAVALVAVTVLVVGLQLLLARQSSRDSVEVLRGRVDAVASTVRFRGDRARVLEAPSDILDQDIWVFDHDGSRIDGGTPPRRLVAQVRRLSSVTSERSVVVGATYRLFALPVLRPGTAASGAVVVAALDLTPYESAERRGLWLSLALGLVSVATAGAAAWSASGYALSQVRRMARRADDWREHDLSGRFELGAPRDELSELANTLDRMLDRIAQALLAERRLTDEVAHELRTPLSAIRSEAQLAQLETDPDAVPSESLGAILAATDRMTASIDTMLVVARSTHADEATCSVREVLSQLRAHGTARDELAVSVDDPDEDILVAAPLRVVGAAVLPLLDNAVRHASTAVRVRVSTESRRVLLHVEDDGPGVHPEHRDDIFLPGHSSEPDGAGLGLALSRRLAHSVGGEVDGRSDGHGHFVLSLPRS